MHILLESFIMHNRYSIGIITKIILLLLLSLLITIDTRVLESTVLLLFILFAFLSSPRSIVMDDVGIRYNLGWKEQWRDIRSFEVENNNITLLLSNDRNRMIKNISPNDLTKVVQFISSKVKLLQNGY
jgi:uncharacterized membrane protein YobD (UPF0266 family)